MNLGNTAKQNEPGAKGQALCFLTCMNYVERMSLQTEGRLDVASEWGGSGETGTGH
jgi:hypothetical protein